MVFSVSERTFAKEVLQASTPVLVNFWAPWCGICKLITPILMRFQAERPEKLKIVTINADESLKLASAYRLTTLPTLILFDGGKIIHRIEGFQGREELRLALEEAIDINQPQEPTSLHFLQPRELPLAK